MRRTMLTAAASAAVLAGLVTGSAGAAGHKPPHARASQAAGITDLRLTASNPQLAACMPNASVKVTDVSTDRSARVRQAQGPRPPPGSRPSFTVFLLEQAGAPFGAAEYIGDITTNKNGDADNTFRAIIDEAFSSQIVNGERVRVDLNQVGMWFADPADDDFCAAAPGINGVTPFDGDNEAGVQAFNSANTQPLPAP